MASAASPLGSAPRNANPESRILTDLPRTIGHLGSTALVVGSIIGSGIFLVPHDVARQVGSVSSMMLVWIVGGILALAGALSLAELGAAVPEAGGVYVYLRVAYGKLFAFLYGWAAVAVIESGGIATLAVAFSIYSTSFFLLTAAQQKLVAASIIALLSMVNIAGVRAAAAVQTVFMFAKLSGLAIIVGFVLFAQRVTPVASSRPLPTPHTTLSSFGVALIGVLWAYHGWHELASAAGEVKDPSHVLPRSYFLGTLLVAVVYLSANLAYLRVLPLATMAQEPYQRVAAKTLEVVWGARGAAFVSALILCSIFGALNGTILGGARACFAMARDGVFFASVGRVHPRFGTPALAILIQGAWAILLAVSGTYQQLYTYVIFTGWLFYAAATFAVVILRRQQPQSARPYRVWGYPLLPIAFSVAALAMVANALARSPRESGIGLALVLLGLPVYFAWSRLAGSGRQ